MFVMTLLFRSILYTWSSNECSNFLMGDSFDGLVLTRTSRSSELVPSKGQLRNTNRTLGEQGRPFCTHSEDTGRAFRASVMDWRHFCLMLSSVRNRCT
uniref:Putative secreted protein n=1 Tax=Ixodes ricinus TaxID=34613 RepID=A0A6B0UDY6_IXORI